MNSIGTMIKRISGLVGTQDVTEWENDFIQNVCTKSSYGQITIGLSDKQIEIIERIHNQHFA